MNIAEIEEGFRPSQDGKAVATRAGVVASAAPGATSAGVRVLEAGGNAIDAACAVSFALGVCEPSMSGVGGQTLAVLHVEGKTFSVDGSSRAPALAQHAILQPGDVRSGYRAATVPGTPATLAWMHRRYGCLGWADVLAPAVSLAAEGRPIGSVEHRLQVRELPALLAQPSRSAARYFLKGGERPFEPGDLFQQPELAALLETLARDGVESFYEGDVAQRIDADMREHGGLLRADDLKTIPWPVERPVLKRRYRGVRIATMPPPGAGRTLLLVMMMLNHVRARALVAGDDMAYHYIAETLRKAFMLRTERPFDPDTYPRVVEKKMLNRTFARELAASITRRIDPTLPVDPEGVRLSDLDDETTHFCVMDAHGNVASVTQSVEWAYGAKVAADGLGFLYNNYLAAFELEDESHPYALKPGGVPWSSAAPSIVFHEGRPWIALGSPGSERIYSSIAQVLMHVVDASMPIDAAVGMPRLHCSIGGTISLEEARFPPTLAAHLARHEYRIEALEPFDLGMGCVQATLARRTGQGFQGVADPRRDGTAGGPAS